MKALEEEEAAKICRQILQATKAEGWQLGKTRVFLRAGQLALLEVSRNNVFGLRFEVWLPTTETQKLHRGR